MASLSLVLFLLAAPAGSEWRLFHERLEAIDPASAGDLLNLGRWCEERKHPLWARKCYEKVCRLGEVNRDAYCEASLRLAGIDLAARRYGPAYERLRELWGKFQLEEARQLLREAESEQTRRQLRYLEQGDEHLERGRYPAALGAFEKAFELAPAASGGGAFVERRVILEKLARARKLADDEYYRSKVLPVERSFEECSACRAASGFEDCSGCGGSGKVKRAVLRRNFRGRLVRSWELVRCESCGGHGYKGCGQCLGLGVVTREFTRREREALKELCDRVRHPRLFREPAAAALKVVEEALLEIEDAPTLNYFRALRPRYVLSRELKQALRQVPPGEADLERLGRLWGRARADHRVGVNFLLNYACEYAGTIRHFDMLRGGATPDLSALPLARPAAEEVLSPELLSAFPEGRSKEWVWVQGLFSGYREKPQRFKGEIALEGEVERDVHSVHFFVWLPSARLHLERLAGSPWRARLEGLAVRYPFSLRERLLQVPRDHHVLLAGRFLRDRLGYPRNWFEVWDLEVGLSREEEAIYQALREPVEEISFGSLPAGRFAAVLRDWFDVEIDLGEVPEGALLACEARDCPLGLVVDAVARQALGATWAFREGRVRFESDALGGLAPAVARVVARLEEENRGRVRARRLAGAHRPQEELPGDPAGLRVVARKAVLEMDYRRADSCFARVLQGSMPVGRAEAIGRVRAKLWLFDQLTRATPVSQLAGAEELAEIVYRLPGGELRQATVRVLRRDARALLVQEAYGARFTLSAEAVRSETSLSGEAWRDRKRAELAAREREVDASPESEEASRLFLLALFAKTNGFTARGHEYLERAAARDGFAWVLEHLAPERAEKLVATWRHATGRDRTAPAVPLARSDPEGIEGSVVTGGDWESRQPSGDEGPGLEGDLLAAPGPLPAAAEELLAHAREEARRGSACLRRALRGEEAGRWRALALTHLEGAREALDRLLEARSDEDAVALRRDVARLVQICTKDLGFFE